MEYGQVKNPKSGRYIYIGGTTYNQLLKEFDRQTLLLNYKSTRKIPKSPSILKHDFLSQYTIGKELKSGKQACVYKAYKDEIPVAIKICQNNAEELLAHQLLSNQKGFIHMIEYFKLPKFPNLTCDHIKPGQVTVYVLSGLKMG